MPQTRYVLSHALRMGLKPIVYINKVDRREADPAAALNETFDLFIELGADDRQADFPVLYGSGLTGWAVSDPAQIRGGESRGMDALFETIIRYVEPPMADLDAVQNAGKHPGGTLPADGVQQNLQGKIGKDSFG